MTPAEIFLLGWREYEKRRFSVDMLSPIGAFDRARLVEPTEAEIRQIIENAMPKPKESQHADEPIQR